MGATRRSAGDQEPGGGSPPGTLGPAVSWLIVALSCGLLALYAYEHRPLEPEPPPEPTPVRLRAADPGGDSP